MTVLANALVTAVWVETNETVVGHCLSTPHSHYSTLPLSHALTLTFMLSGYRSSSIHNPTS